LSPSYQILPVVLAIKRAINPTIKRAIKRAINPTINPTIKTGGCHQKGLRGCPDLGHPETEEADQ